jgi:uncharacterized phiE125 gp8 family phage protein
MKLITPASLEPVTVTELARNLRLFTGDGDYMGAESVELQALISAARADAEHYTGRFFAEQTLEAHYRDFNSGMRLQPDLLSVGQVRYYDVDNLLQVISPELYFTSQGGVVFFNSTFFPAVYQRGDAVLITFTVGAAFVEPTVKQAILLIASHWYENREASSPLQVRDVPLSYQWLLDSHRILRIA